MCESCLDELQRRLQVYAFIHGGSKCFRLFRRTIHCIIRMCNTRVVEKKKREKLKNEIVPALYAAFSALRCRWRVKRVESFTGAIIRLIELTR